MRSHLRVGTIGCVLAAHLALAGNEVVGIARGAMLDPVRAAGELEIVTPREPDAPRSAAGQPSEIDWRHDDVIVLTIKTNDTLAALEALRDAGVVAQPIVCAQNGVANERMALRLFPSVYGMVVMLPAKYLAPGIVVAHGAPKLGILDVGRVPSGVDDRLDGFAAGWRRRVSSRRRRRTSWPASTASCS